MDERRKRKECGKEESLGKGKEDRKDLELQNKSRSKGAQNESKTHRKGGKGKGNPDSGGDSVPAGNDPSWYELTPEIAAKTANFYYGYLPGVGYPLSVSYVNDQNDISTPELETYVPSVMAIDYFPSFGTSNSKVSGLNMAATQLYTWYRQANSGARNYEAPDLMMYCLAMVDALSTWFYIRRCLQVVKFMPRENRNYPRALARAMCFNYDDAVDNYAQYCARLNLLTVKFNSWAVPAEFDAIKRAIYINSQVFTDSNSIRGQSYVFVKRAYYEFDGKASAEGSMLKLKKLGITDGTWNFDNPATIGLMLDQLDECLTALYYDEDITIMSGDTLKAFKDNIITLPEFIPEKELLSIVYDEDVLAQIENLNFVSVRLNNKNWSEALGSTFNYIQGSGQITCNPAFVVTETTVGNRTSIVKDRLLNSRKDDPTYRDNLEWTRLMPTYDLTLTSSDTPKPYIAITSCGLEIPVQIRIISNQRTGGTVIPVTRSNLYSTVNVVGQEGTQMNDIATFDWHPMIYEYVTGVVAGGLFIYGDIKFPTVVAESVLKSLNDAAQQAVFSRKVKGSNKMY